MSDSFRVVATCVTAKYWKHNSCILVVLPFCRFFMLQHDHNTNTTSPQYHHKNTTISPQYNPTTKNSQCHQNIPTKLPQYHHNTTTMPPYCHHNATTIPPQYHHYNTTNTMQIAFTPFIFMFLLALLVMAMRCNV